MLWAGFSLGCIAAIFLAVFIDFRRLAVAQAFLCLLVSASAFLIHQALPESWRWLSGDIMTALPALFWFTCRLGFVRRRQFIFTFSIIAVLSFLLPAIGRPFGAHNTDAGLIHLLLVKIPQFTEYFLILHGLWSIYEGWDEDLVQRRRNLRIGMAITVGITLLITTVSLNSGLLPRESLHFLAAICALLVAYIIFSGRADALFGPSTPTEIRAEIAKANSLLEEISANKTPNTQKTSPEIKTALDPKVERFEKPLNELMRNGYYRNEKLTLKKLALELDAPESQLRALINKKFGYRNFSDYINQLRIAEAVIRLEEEPETPIQNIALDAGYRTLSSFNRAFRDIKGCTPTSLRHAIPPKET